MGNNALNIQVYLLLLNIRRVLTAYSIFSPLGTFPCTFNKKNLFKIFVNNSFNNGILFLFFFFFFLSREIQVPLIICRSFLMLWSSRKMRS